MILTDTPISGLLASGGLLCIGTIWAFLGSAATTVASIFTKKESTATYENMYKQAQEQIAAGQAEIVKLKQSKTTTYMIIGILAIFVIIGFFVFKRK